MASWMTGSPYGSAVVIKMPNMRPMFCEVRLENICAPSTIKGENDLRFAHVVARRRRKIAEPRLFKSFPVIASGWKSCVDRSSLVKSALPPERRCRADIEQAEFKHGRFSPMDLIACCVSVTPGRSTIRRCSRLPRKRAARFRSCTSGLETPKRFTRFSMVSRSACIFGIRNSRSIGCWTCQPHRRALCPQRGQRQA